ncbi:hypothetical protein IL306_000338, partial [Fusarium sp. DS 682]
MVHRYWLVALPVLVLDAAQGVVATSKSSPAGLHILPLVGDQKDSGYNSYVVEVAAGTPPQKMKLNLDIAKSTTCMISLLTAIFFGKCDGGCDDGFYQLNKSKTSSPILGHESVEYGDPTTYPPSNITWNLDVHKDTLKIANIAIPKQVFGLQNPYNNKVVSGIGALGLGPSLEYGYKPGKPFNSVLDNLAANKQIASRTYSLDIYNHGSNPGLRQTVPKGKNHASEVHSYEVHKNDSVFLLDSTNQYLRFRHSFVDPLYKTLGAVNNGQDAYFVPCEKRNMPGSWDFQFGDVTIKIPYKKIITTQSSDKGKTCWVGVLTTWKGQLVLGQPFLEAAYLAFDLDNKQVALAPPANCGQ